MKKKYIRVQKLNYSSSVRLESYLQGKWHRFPRRTHTLHYLLKELLTGGCHLETEKHMGVIFIYALNAGDLPYQRLKREASGGRWP
jgi:hypothetical protein